MRLIDLDALLKFPIRIDHYDKANGNEHFIFGIETVIEYAENLPAVDAMPVVRCKDCKHWMYEYDDVGLCVADVPDIDGVERTAFNFCSIGERKTE